MGLPSEYTLSVVMGETCVTCAGGCAAPGFAGAPPCRFLSQRRICSWKGRVVSVAVGMGTVVMEGMVDIDRTGDVGVDGSSISRLCGVGMSQGCCWSCAAPENCTKAWERDRREAARSVCLSMAAEYGMMFCRLCLSINAFRSPTHLCRCTLARDSVGRCKTPFVRLTALCWLQVYAFLGATSCLAAFDSNTGAMIGASCWGLGR